MHKTPVYTFVNGNI